MKDKYAHINISMIKIKCYKYLTLYDCMIENHIVIYNRQVLRIEKNLSVDLYIPVII